MLVGAGTRVTSCDLRILADQAAKPLPAQDPDSGARSVRIRGAPKADPLAAPVRPHGRPGSAMNAICERLVGALRRELVDRVLIRGKATCASTWLNTRCTTTRPGRTRASPSAFPTANTKVATSRLPILGRFAVL
jgi:hypothetical protein